MNRIKHIFVECSSAFPLHFMLHFLKSLPVTLGCMIIASLLCLLSCLILHVIHGCEKFLNDILDGTKLLSKYNSFPLMLKIDWPFNGI